MNKLTPTQKRALEILNGIKEPYKGIKTSAFAYQFYESTEHEYLITASSNQGNGACAGKKAWLCAGSYLSKLCKKGLVRRYYDKSRGFVYAITYEGEKALKSYNETCGHCSFAKDFINGKRKQHYCQWKLQSERSKKNGDEHKAYIKTDDKICEIFSKKTP